MPNSFFGKYRGTVVSNADPLNRGRLLAVAYDVLGDAPLAWANACIPASVDGRLPCVPSIGAEIWIEFEAGEQDRPIWSGTMWSLPPDDGSSDITILQGESFNIVQKVGGNVVISAANGTSITMGTATLVLQTSTGASIELAGPSVSINNGALEIT